MNTPWTDDLCRQASEAMVATKLRTALKLVTTVLSVYPEHELALGLAGVILKLGMAKSENQSAKEPLAFGDLLDTRLDRLFCSCEWPGCRNSWVSSRVAFRAPEIKVRNPIGGRCQACGKYTCRTHFATQTDRTAICPQCGGRLNYAPPANGRTPSQTVRLNQPVVHVVLLREGPLPPSRDFIRVLLDVQAPDVLEDGATISVFHDPNWSDDPEGLASALVARDHPDYIGGEFDVHSASGYEQDGVRWALVKIFKKTPKHVDPTVLSV